MTSFKHSIHEVGWVEFIEGVPGQPPELHRETLTGKQKQHEDRRKR